MEAMPSKAWSSGTLDAALAVVDEQQCKQESNDESLEKEIQDSQAYMRLL